MIVDVTLPGLFRARTQPQRLVRSLFLFVKCSDRIYRDDMQQYCGPCTRRETCSVIKHSEMHRERQRVCSSPTTSPTARPRILTIGSIYGYSSESKGASPTQAAWRSNRPPHAQLPTRSAPSTMTDTMWPLLGWPTELVHPQAEQRSSEPLYPDTTRYYGRRPEPGFAPDHEVQECHPTSMT